MTTPLFERDGDRYAATPLTSGPWDTEHCHGGATSALLAQLVEQVGSLVPMHTARLTVELLRPVTREPFEVRTEVMREGRRVQLVRAALLRADGTELSTATGLRVRRGELALPEDADPLPPGLERGPDALSSFTGSDVWQAGFFEAAEVRLAEGALGVPSHGPGTPGVAAGWIRLRVPVVDDEPITALSRLAAAGDFGNGISAPLPMDRYLFINPDLTIAVDRFPVDEWVGVASRSTTQATGVGRTVTALADHRGRLGTALQSLYVAER